MPLTPVLSSFRPVDRGRVYHPGDDHRNIHFGHHFQHHFGNYFGHEFAYDSRIQLNDFCGYDFGILSGDFSDYDLDDFLNIALDDVSDIASGDLSAISQGNPSTDSSNIASGLSFVQASDIFFVQQLGHWFSTKIAAVPSVQRGPHGGTPVFW